MAESIESFVAKLQEEGVQAGKDAAEKILEKGHADAERIVQEAEAKARKIIEEAQAVAASTLDKSKTDLRLAARDTALRLRDALTRAVRAVIAAGAKEPLVNPDFIKATLHDLVMEYVKADLDKRVNLVITTRPEMQQQLTDWAMQHIHRPAGEADVYLDLKGTLADAGFEYEVDGATIEVTLASVVEALSELVNPNLREMLEHAMAEPKE